jgi:lauroyl/myristoyl acyltransferase
MREALGEPESVVHRWTAAVLDHERRFRRDYLQVLQTGAPDPRWHAFELAGPMFYRTYVEMSAGRPLVMLMPHMGCFVSGLFHLHQYSPWDRPLCAFRRSAGPAQTARLFERLGESGPPVALLDERRHAAVSAYACLRRGGVVFSFIDSPLDSIAARACDPVDLFAVPTALPDGPIRLAVAAGALLGFVFVSASGPRRLRITFSDPIDPRAEPDQQCALDIARRWMAAQLECAVATSPTEWLNWPLLGELWKQGTWQAQNPTTP